MVCCRNVRFIGSGVIDLLLDIRNGYRYLFYLLIMVMILMVIMVGCDIGNIICSSSCYYCVLFIWVVLMILVGSDRKWLCIKKVLNVIFVRGRMMLVKVLCRFRCEISV